MKLRYTPPTNHTFGSLSDKWTAHKGMSENVPGILYCWSPVISAIFNDKTEWVDVKIGVAHGSEAQAVARAEAAATDNGCDIHYHWILAVEDCAAAEGYIGNYLHDEGYSTKHGWDKNLPKRYKKFFQRQSGGKEWYVLPMTKLKEAYDLTKRFMKKAYGEPEILDIYEGRNAKKAKKKKFMWIGESQENDPVRFEIDSYGNPVADMTKQFGGVVKQKKLDYCFMIRRMTGIAPEGCKSQDDRYTEWVA